jgi:hypothetical protein
MQRNNLGTPPITAATTRSENETDEDITDKT